MAQLDHSLGKHRDWPQVESINLNGSSAGGISTDYEHPIAYVPQLPLGAVSGSVGDLPLNAQNVRKCFLIFEAAVTGANTNNFTLNFLQRRGGALLVNTTPPVSTTSATTISAGSQVVTPASMANIAVGIQLFFSGGTGASETVTVTAATSTTFTATFANGHSGAYTITSVSTITATGVQSYTPASMTNIVAGTQLVVSGGTGTTETVTVLSVTATSFSTNFAQTHSANFTLQSAPLATVTYASGTNEVAYVPHEFQVPISKATVLLPGDIMSLQRISNGSGMASPALTAGVDLVPAGIGN